MSQHVANPNSMHSKLDKKQQLFFVKCFGPAIKIQSQTTSKQEYEINLRNKHLSVLLSPLPSYFLRPRTAGVSLLLLRQETDCMAGVPQVYTSWLVYRIFFFMS